MAESNDFLKPQIPRFDGHYEHWAMLMENLLRSKELWGLIEAGAPANANADQQQPAAASKLQDLKVKNYLFQSIERSILETILDRDTTRDIWEAMRRKYQGSTKVKRAQLQALRREFEVLAMKDNESVNDYFGRTLAIANHMSAQGERLEQVTVVEKILRSMPSKYNYVVCSIEQSSNVTTLSIDELQSNLIVQEQRMKAHQGISEVQALKITNPGRGNGRGRGRNSTNASRGCGRGRLSKEHVECFKCHKLGHYQSECPDWEGDDSRMVVMGKWNVKLNINQVVHIISNVYFVPKLKTNLLSVGQLQQKQIIMIFQNDLCKVYHEEKELLFTTEMTSNRMYIVSASVMTPRCPMTNKQESTLLWHDRYAHLSFKGLNTLSKKQLVKGLLVFEAITENCVDCLAGKQHREIILKQANWRASGKLELVHLDICGPINPQSNGGNMYFITFTDDFSRKTWLYVLKDKANALEVFKEFKARVEKESGCSIVCLRSDRGGEYTSNDFNEFCRMEGIKRQLTATYTPQQNGVSERKNRTLLNMVRSMISARKVLKEFWPEAALWATYVLNSSPTLSVKDMTPEKAWSGVKPSVHHFKTWCVAYAHVNDAKRKKLDSKSQKCVLLGVSEESKAYKLYDPISKKIIISRDVIFEESKGWNWNNTHNESEQNNDWEYNESVDDILENGETTEDVINGLVDNINQEEVAVVDNTTSESDNDLESPPNQIRSTTRMRKPSVRLNDYVTGREAEEDNEPHSLAIFKTDEDPMSYDEAAKLEVWRQAMKAEIKSIKKNNTWELTSLPEDVKSAFLHGELTEDIYVVQPLGNDNGDKKMVSKAFEKCPHEHTLFVKFGPKDEILIVSLYVDDLILTGNNLDMIEDFKRSMKKKFDMTDLGRMSYFLFGMENCNKVCNPIVPSCKLIKNENGKAKDATLHKQMVGCLMYLLATRPDLAYSVCLVARFMERPTEIHFAAVKRIMRYLKGTLSFGIRYKTSTDGNLQLKGWSDSDYAGDLDDRKSTTEAEYVSAASCACQAIWLRNILSYLQLKQEKCTVIFCDNNSSIKLSKNPIMHGRCKHIDVRFHFLRDLTKDDIVELMHCKSEQQLVDILTKPLKLESFCRLREGLGMVELN
ncbi:hypothetical protein TSUD_31390 [Trifolium subterraneum]|uniref:Integrase catalytic domain-containing protein n=1 Tax=Trifolium subterraneum TaxID=3900 RepID=A0A2Z6NLG8_TRISU|nr:hypothetical protein TSUD_31390 [Trifolium subterraneum]